MPSNRELASLILLGTFVIACIAVPRLRRSVLPSCVRVIRALFVWRVLILFAGLVVWSTGWIVLAGCIGFWEFGLLKDSIIIVVMLGFPILFRAVNAKSGTEVFKQIRSETLSISAFLAFYLNLEPFPLWGELVLQPFVMLVQLLNVVAGMKAEHRQIQRFTSGILVLTGVIMLVWSTIQVASKSGSYDVSLLAKTLGLSIWLPLLMFPYFYGAALFGSTESILQRVQRPGGEAQLHRVRVAIFLGLRLSVKLASRFTGRYNNVARSTTFRETWRGMRDFRADVRRRDKMEGIRLTNLTRYAGVTGVDDDGAQLDRREFRITKKRLEWIWTTQVGRYESNGNRFWIDLTDMMVDAKHHGMPEHHGFVTESTKDRKKWRAWRQLPSGWFLGIGGTAQKTQYLYQGSKPPYSWPPDPRQWTNAATETWPSDWNRSDEPQL